MKIIGTSSADTLNGGFGDDVIRGLGGADILNGGEGQDRLFGGAGDDSLTGGSGDDVLYTGGGADTVDGGAGDDIVVYQGGDLVMLWSEGHDLLDAHAYAKSIHFAFFNLTDFLGGKGNDQVYGQMEVDSSMDGGAGDDTLSNRSGDDTMIGGVGDDTLSGGWGRDSVIGGKGDDILFLIDDSHERTDVDLRMQDAWQQTSMGSVWLDGIEGINGGGGSDHLVGDAGDNWLSTGYSGADFLQGGDGDDTLDAAMAGHATVAGGAGTDTLSFFTSTDESRQNFSLVSGYASAAIGVSLAYSGIENLAGSIYRDFLYGDAGDNVLSGDSGSDEIEGGAGNDRLYGDGRVDSHGLTIETTYKPGYDRLLGGDGNDTLVGGIGGDDLAGGEGNDRFVYLTIDDAGKDKDSANIDMIRDLQLRDWIDLSAIDADVNAEGDQAFHRVDHFTGDAGELVVQHSASMSFIMLDDDGDGKLDMVIKIIGDLKTFDHFVL